MSEFEDAFDRVRWYVESNYSPDGDGLVSISLKADVEPYLSDLKVVIDRLDKMIKEQREEALSEMAKYDAELILKGY